MSTFSGNLHAYMYILYCTEYGYIHIYPFSFRNVYGRTHEGKYIYFFKKALARKEERIVTSMIRDATTTRGGMMNYPALSKL